MEIEAKFAVPDVETFRRLRAADQLAGLALSPAQIKQVSDTYLDTPDRRVLAAGYACRRREEPEGIIMTLKGLRGLEGAVHRREELEVQLPADQPPAEWPDSPVRDLALQLIGDAPLISLFNLHQTRILRVMSQGQQTVAQLSLDEVRLSVAGRDQAYFELEAELAPPGSEDDLAAIVANLQDEWGLRPEPRSKFERALAFLEETPPDRRLLTPQQRLAYQRIAERGDAYSRRARALLALDAGATQTDAGGYAGLSARQVRHWLSAFRKQRTDIFPGRLLNEAEAAPAPVSPETPEAPAPPELPGLAPPQPLSLETLFERYQVDQAHARTVADHALALFDHLHSFHGLPSGQRPLLETAALLHNVGMVTDPDRHHIVGRDILLAHPLSEFDDTQRLMLALITFLHRKRITRQKLSKLVQPPFDVLSEPAMQQALAMAALVRMADGLDYSQTESSQLELVWHREGLVEIEVTGPEAAVDAERAQTKSDLWRLLFDVDLQFKPVQMAVIEPKTGHFEVLEHPDEETLSPAPAELPAQPGLEADDPIAEAARKVLGFHFQRMVYHEPGTRLGEDVEALHDMRVATRRMRAAFRLFGDYLDMEELAPIVKGLRRTGRILGAVRDLDVFWLKTQRYLEALPPEQPVDLGPLQAAWKAQRERGREEMLAYLESDRYARFKEQFEEFLQAPGAGTLPVMEQAAEPVAYRVRHVVPAALYQRLAAVQGFNEWVSRPDVPLSRYHQLRIVAKGLRYALEFFQEVLGPEAETVIDEVKALQDHLGDLQDAVVASNLLRDFLMWGTWGHVESQKKVAWPTETVVAPGVAAYLSTRQAELQQLVRTFPQAWTRFQTPEFSRLLASALAPLWL